MAETLKDVIYLLAVTPVDVQWLNCKPCRIEQDENDEDLSESRYLKETLLFLCEGIYHLSRHLNFQIAEHKEGTMGTQPIRRDCRNS